MKTLALVAIASLCSWQQCDGQIFKREHHVHVEAPATEPAIPDISSRLDERLARIELLLERTIDRQGELQQTIPTESSLAAIFSQIQDDTFTELTNGRVNIGDGKLLGLVDTPPVIQSLVNDGGLIDQWKTSPFKEFGIVGLFIMIGLQWLSSNKTARKVDNIEKIQIGKQQSRDSVARTIQAVQAAQGGETSSKPSLPIVDQFTTS